MERLEHQLGIALFEQGEEGYHPTPAGRRALEVADQVTRLMTGLTEELKNHDAVTRRKLRLAISSDLGSEFMPQISAFLKAHPDIDVTLLSTPHPAESVVQRKSDICLCLADRQPDHLRGRRLGSLRQAGYAARGYIEKRGQDLTRPDLKPARTGAARLRMDPLFQLVASAGAAALGRHFLRYHSRGNAGR